MAAKRHPHRTSLTFVALTVLIGWTVAYGTLYSVGSPNVRPTGQHQAGYTKVYVPSLHRWGWLQL